MLPGLEHGNQKGLDSPLHTSILSYQEPKEKTKELYTPDNLFGLMECDEGCDWTLRYYYPNLPQDFLKVTAMPRDTEYFLAAELIDVTVQLFVPKTRAVSLLGYSIYVIIYPATN